jgi:uncharacterized heparinase superfamily protein
LRIEDTISGAFHGAEARFHLHPEVEAKVVSSREVLLAWRDGAGARVVFDGAATVEVGADTWHPQFGVAVANRRISARFSGAWLTTRIVWSQAP